MIDLLSQDLQIPHDRIVCTFKQGQYRGAWVHRDLATDVATYCDNTGRLKLAVSRAITALADRTPMPAAGAAPSVPVSVPLSDQEKALGIMHVAAAEEKALAVKVKHAELEERRLSLAKQYSELERNHVKEIGNIKVSNRERQAAAKRKQQADSEQHASKQARMAADERACKEKNARREAEYCAKQAANARSNQAAKDKQSQLRAQAHRNPASQLTSGSTLMSAAPTFAMSKAVNQAAKDIGVAEHLVKKFMGANQGKGSGYQKVLEEARLVKAGTELRVDGKVGHYERGVYPMSKFQAAVNWIKKNYKDVTPRVHLPMGNPMRRA